MEKQFQQRRKKLKNAVKQLGVNGILVTNIKNIRYLSGFSGSSAHLLVTPKTEILMSDTRYEQQLKTEVSNLEIDIRDSTTTLLDSVHRIVKLSGLNSLAIESATMAKANFDEVETKLPAVTLVSSQGVVEKLRAVKDSSEILAIRNSIRVNQRAFRVIKSQLASHQSEREIAHNLEHQMRAFGAKGCAFDPIVGVGPRAALPHGQPSEMKINQGTNVLIDWGAEVDGYLSDLTRSIITSKKTTAKFRKIYETVLKAQLAAIKKIRPGATLKSVDTAARKVISDAGFEKYFGHGTGHSFGLEIHEHPYISPVAKGKLEAGMIVTVEPGIYIPEVAGVRIEDDVLVTPDGYEVLSSLPKQLEECLVEL
jgi:Xaa-Pro aminopeptidase